MDARVPFSHPHLILRLLAAPYVLIYHQLLEFDMREIARELTSLYCDIHGVRHVPHCDRVVRSIRVFSPM